jgi:hypothetical protein
MTCQIKTWLLVAYCKKPPNSYFFTTQRTLITSPLTGGRRRSSLPPRFGHPQACSDPARLCSGHPQVAPFQPPPRSPEVGVADVCASGGAAHFSRGRRRGRSGQPAPGKKRATGAGDQAGGRHREARASPNIMETSSNGGGGRWVARSQRRRRCACSQGGKAA